METEGHYNLASSTNTPDSFNKLQIARLFQFITSIPYNFCLWHCISIIVNTLKMPQLWTHLIRQEWVHHCYKITFGLTHYNSNTSRTGSITALGTSLIHVVSSIKHSVAVQPQPQLESIVNMRTGPTSCTQHNAVLKPGTGFYSLIKMCKA